MRTIGGYPGYTSCLRPAAALLAPHDISPLLDEQLILELEAWVMLDKAANVLPGSEG